MSLKSTRRAVCKEIADYIVGANAISLKDIDCVLGPPGIFTPFCIIYLRKSGIEFRIDYDNCLIKFQSIPSLHEIEIAIRNSNFSSTHNVYPPGHFEDTFTKQFHVSEWMKERMSNYLLSYI